MDRKLKDAALRYAELGYRVFPCRPGSKEPTTEHGCLDATTDVEQIERWWQSMPQANVAISTDGYLVVDVDPAGKPWVGTVDRQDLLSGAMAVTPRGGSHHWFKQNGTELRNTSGKLAPGVDTRADGGYVLVPPSVVNGQPYRWVVELESRQPVVPAWLAEQLGQRQPVRDTVGEQIPEGSRNQTLMRFAGYLRRSGMGREEIAGCLGIVNQARCRPPVGQSELASLAKSAARYEPDYVQEALLMDHFAPEPAEPGEKRVEFPVDCLTGMPAVLKQAYDWVISGAIKPQPELTLGALVALFGAVIGQKVRDDYDTRTNIMVLGLSPSGSGKEWPRQCNKQLLTENGLELVNGPERIGSHAGIVTSLAHHSVRLFQLDEIGRLLTTMRDPKASHLYNIGTVLMALYSSSNTVWTGDAYADLTKVKRLVQPHVCVFGTSVPESLYAGLSPENLTDGLVGRLVTFQSDSLPDRQKPERIPSPWLVTEWIRMWREYVPKGSGNLEVRPARIEKTPEADQRHEHYCNLVHAKHRGEDNVSASVWSRAPEKAAKLALIFACSQGMTTDFRITLEAEEWGIKLANYSTRLVLQAARNVIAGSRYEADLKFVFSKIVGKIPHSELVRKTQRLTPRERVGILADLQSQGAIEMVIETTKTRPKTYYQRIRDVL
jgi:hypothetical protein